MKTYMALLVIAGLVGDGWCWRMSPSGRAGRVNRQTHLLMLEIESTARPTEALQTANAWPTRLPPRLDPDQPGQSRSHQRHQSASCAPRHSSSILGCAGR
jgi:hypothetical protein